MAAYRGYPRLSAQEKAARMRAIGEFFSALGVAAGEERMRAFGNATCWIPWEHQGVRYFQAALDSAVNEKRDGYNTAPQPGQIWAAFEKLIPQSQWSHTGTQGSLPPRWCRELGQSQRNALRLTGGTPREQIPAEVSAQVDRILQSAGDDSEPVL